MVVWGSRAKVAAAFVTNNSITNTTFSPPTFTFLLLTLLHLSCTIWHYHHPIFDFFPRAAFCGSGDKWKLSLLVDFCQSVWSFKNSHNHFNFVLWIFLSILAPIPNLIKIGWKTQNLKKLLFVSYWSGQSKNSHSYLQLIMYSFLPNITKFNQNWMKHTEIE